MTYSSTAEVRAWTAHLLNGQSTFNSTTRPTGTQLNAMLSRASTVLDVALAQNGLAVPLTGTPKLAADDWVTARAAAYAEMTQRGQGFDHLGQPTDGQSRSSLFLTLYGEADAFAKSMASGLLALGATENTSMAASQAATFTGEDAEASREDPTNTALRQPRFRMGQFDFRTNTTGSNL